MLTDLQRYNLSTLADYLIELPVDYGHFKMRVYNCDDRGLDGICIRNSDHCGSSACAVGHVPYTGIVGWETQSSWNAVADNLLGAPIYSPEYRFLFSQDNVDCPWAAALRIRHYLNTGSVDDFHYPHGLTLEQYQNLRRLAAYLVALPDDYDEFDMSWWADDLCCRPKDAVCGTVGCAGGHGPRAGIDPIPGEDWEDYIARAFGGDFKLQTYIFGSAWSYVDNTPQGAGKRILYALHNGIPDSDDPTIYGG
ncbi:hypothetical protein KNJ79_05165 [Sphingopyxis indica]|uniref:hypothetical protein n=1 Tax=Sphingopyxis indica TaxID=436663 RepID=UPI002938DCEF|nr:hypothetical protein [Sphingopyxis indica]WOF44322.1 hypothetical protein KNJ79_05165 [Sphingopyxis indica]